MSVGIKSNNGSRGSLDAIYISKGRLGRGNTDWIDRCKGTFTLLTRRIRVAYNQRKAGATLECVHSFVGGSFIEPF